MTDSRKVILRFLDGTLRKGYIRVETVPAGRSFRELAPSSLSTGLT
ncbi:MAG: hypothetical protein AABZ10_13810 [Nitrospirota bacterium]